MKINSNFIRVAELAQKAGVHPNTIKNHIKAGLLPVRRSKPVTGLILISVNDATRYLNSNSFGGEAL